MSRVYHFLLIGSLSVLFIGNVYSQRSSKKDTDFKQKLWYGGSVGLGFQSFASQSTFLFALYPMMGYKITETISFGPRLGASYRSIRTRFNGAVSKFNPVEISGAFFGRAKVLRQFFGHVEYELANEKTVTSSSTISSRIDTNFYLGGGYNSGGKVGSEIYILYNLLEDGNSLEVPFVIRAGLTVNF